MCLGECTLLAQAAGKRIPPVHHAVDVRSQTDVVMCVWVPMQRTYLWAFVSQYQCRFIKLRNK